MDNFVQIDETTYLNLTEVLKIEAHGQNYAISVREGNVIAQYYCHPSAPGYSKLKQLLAKAK